MAFPADPGADWQMPHWIVIIKRNIKPKLHGGQAVRLLSMNLILIVNGALYEILNRQDIRQLVTRQIRWCSGALLRRSVASCGSWKRRQA